MGDFVETFPVPLIDAIRMNHAAKSWAYHHGVRTRVNRFPQGDDTFCVRVTLVSLTRKGDYD